jgi:hypothetical protein
MTTIWLTGHITKDGKLELELPEGLPAGEVEVMLQVRTQTEVETDDDTPLTPAEIAELLIPKPVPTKDIVTGGWEDLDIGDSAEWVEKMRSEEEERRTARW